MRNPDLSKGGRRHHDCNECESQTGTQHETPLSESAKIAAYSNCCFRQAGAYAIPDCKCAPKKSLNEKCELTALRFLDHSKHKLGSWRLNFKQTYILIDGVRFCLTRTEQALHSCLRASDSFTVHNDCQITAACAWQDCCCRAQV